MPDLQAVLSEAVELNKCILEFLRFSTYTKFSDLSGLDIDYMDGDQLFLWDELLVITDHLAKARASISYLTRSVTEENDLRKGTDGKYRTETGRCYDCGSSIEALVTDKDREVPYWTKTVVLHNGEDYYLFDFEDHLMEGLRVRVR